jgi:Domain of unknown function (DUF5710)
MTSRHEDPPRVWLDVPFAEKNQAKALGARWDPAIRRWYAPVPAVTDLARWAALPDIPDVLPGQDRSLGSGFRGPGAHLMLVHQRPLLRDPQGLGTTSSDDH